MLRSLSIAMVMIISTQSPSSFPFSLNLPDTKMQLKTLIPLAIPLFLSLLQPCPAPIGQAIGLAIRVGTKFVHAGNDIADHVNNNNNSRRTIPEIFPRANTKGKGKGKGKSRGNGHGHSNKNKQNDSNDDDLLANLPQPAANLCKQQLANVEVKFHVDEKNHHVKIYQVPPACMTLATVFLGDNPTGGAPVPLGKPLPSVLDRMKDV